MLLLTMVMLVLLIWKFDAGSFRAAIFSYCVETRMIPVEVGWFKLRAGERASVTVKKKFKIGSMTLAEEI